MTKTFQPITGSIPAMVTPMLEDGSVDYASLRKLIDWHIAEGTDCIGVVGISCYRIWRPYHCGHYATHEAWHCAHHKAPKTV
jgi:hypothetical protein